jgi:hypothetical protein
MRKSMVSITALDFHQVKLALESVGHGSFKASFGRLG